MRRQATLRGLGLGVAVVLSGLTAVFHGLSQVKSQDVAQSGAVSMHVDDAESLTLDAQPWVRLQEAWLFSAMATPVADPGGDVVVPVGSRQLLGDCVSGEAAAGPRCANVRLAVVMTAAQWATLAGRGQPGFPAAVEGLVLADHAPETRAAWTALQARTGIPPARRVLLRLGAHPTQADGARWYVLWGAVAVLVGGMMVVWFARTRPAR